MKNKKVYYYDADSLLRTEDFIHELIDNREKLIKWLSYIDIDSLVKIEIDDTATFEEIAKQVLKDYLDGEEDEWEEFSGEYYCSAIFDSDRKFIGFGKACFECSIDYTGKVMYRHVTQEANTEAGVEEEDGDE